MAKNNGIFGYGGIGFLIAIVLIAGYKQHERNKNRVISISEKILNKNGVTQFSIDDINLPINYTILNQQVKSTLFISKNSKTKLIEVDVIPKGSYPFISIFKSQMYVQIDPLTMMGLMDEGEIEKKINNFFQNIN